MPPVLGHSRPLAPSGETARSKLSTPAGRSATLGFERRLLPAAAVCSARLPSPPTPGRTNSAQRGPSRVFPSILPPPALTPPGQPPPTQRETPALAALPSRSHSRRLPQLISFCPQPTFPRRSSCESRRLDPRRAGETRRALLGPAGRKATTSKLN